MQVVLLVQYILLSRVQLCVLMIWHNLDEWNHDVCFNHIFEIFFLIYILFCIMLLYDFIDIIFNFEIKFLDGLPLSRLQVHVVFSALNSHWVVLVICHFYGISTHFHDKWHERTSVYRCFLRSALSTCGHVDIVACTQSETCRGFPAFAAVADWRQSTVMIALWCRM